MEYKDYIIDAINKSKDEVISIRNDIEYNKENIDEIKDIIERLKLIELSLKPKQKWFKEKINSLDAIYMELSETRYDIMFDKTDIMFEIIEKNLLDDMYLESVKNNSYLRNIKFNGEKVGSIEVLEEYKPEIKIRVNVYENSHEFDIYEPYRMYSIISFINTKFNYKET